MLILWVDDKVLDLNLMKMKLINLGYSNVVTRNSYESALEYLDTHKPDLVILDYYLDKSNTGLKLVSECLLNTGIPVIFISSFYGNDVFTEIMNVHPTHFLPKNASEFEIEKTIMLSMSRINLESLNRKISEFIFVKEGQSIKKIAVANIEYVEVVGKYLCVFAENEKNLVRSSLNNLMRTLPDNFIKVHQSYVVNLSFLDAISLEDEDTLKVGKASLPISRNYKKDILKAYYHP